MSIVALLFAAAASAQTAAVQTPAPPAPQDKKGPLDDRAIRDLGHRILEGTIPNPSARSEIGSSTPKIVFEGGTKDGAATIFIGRRGFEKSYSIKFTGEAGGSGRDNLATWDGLPAGASVELGAQRLLWKPSYDVAKMDAACRVSLAPDLAAGYAAGAGGPYIGLVNTPITLAADVPAALLASAPEYEWTLPNGSQAFTRSVTVTLKEPGVKQAKLIIRAAGIELKSSALIAAGKSLLSDAALSIEDRAVPPWGYLTYDINGRYRLAGLPPAGTYVWDRGDQSAQFGGVALAPAKYAALMGGDPERQMPRLYRVAVGFVDANGGAAVAGREVLTGPVCSVMNIKHSEAARRLAADAIEWGTPFFIGARVGAGLTGFAYVDGNETKKEEELGSSWVTVTSALMLSSDLWLRLNYKYKRAYDGGDAFDTCLARGDSTTATVCEELFEKRPLLKPTQLIEFNVQRTLSANFAVQPRVARDIRRKAWLLSLPAYFVQNTDKGLTGGVELGWRSDKNGVSAIVFLGALLDFGQ